MEQSIGRRKAEFIEAGRTAWRVARGRQARRRISSYATFLLAMPASWKALSDVPSTKSWRWGSSPVDLDRSVAEMTEEPRESGALAEGPAVAEPQQAEAAGADKGTPGACGADASRSPTPRRASLKAARTSCFRSTTTDLPSTEASELGWASMSEVRVPAPDGSDARIRRYCHGRRSCRLRRTRGATSWKRRGLDSRNVGLSDYADCPGGGAVTASSPEAQALCTFPGVSTAAVTGVAMGEGGLVDDHVR